MQQYFQNEEVIKLDSIQDLKIQKVIYHYWVNNAKEEEVKVLDTLEIVFDNGKDLSLSGRTDECLKIVTPQIEIDKIKLQEDFGGKIKISSLDVTDTQLWKDASLLQHISLRKGENGAYLNDAVLLSFKNKEIIIYFDSDSIEAEEVFEELDE